VPPGHKSLTLRLRLGSADKTLVRGEIDEAARRVASGVGQRFGGTIRD
jgi:phenylalanyl-tRNA synthetase beta subunit